MTDTRPKIYFGKILSSSCMQQIVVARITHVRIALRADWKINRYHRARLVSSNRDWFAYYRHTTPIFTHSLYVYAGETIMPPRVLAHFGLWAKTLRGQLASITIDFYRVSKISIRYALLPHPSQQVEVEVCLPSSHYILIKHWSSRKICISLKRVNHFFRTAFSVV